MRFAKAFMVIEIPDVPMEEESLIEDSHSEVSEILDGGGEKDGLGGLVTLDEIDQFIPSDEPEEVTGGL